MCSAVRRQGFKALSPLTPGPFPVRGSPRVPHAHHKEPWRPAHPLHILPQPNLPHRGDAIGVPSHEPTVQRRLHRLPLSWLRNGKCLIIYQQNVWNVEASQGCRIKSPTRMEQVMRDLCSWTLANVWKRAFLRSLCTLRASQSRLRGSETPPVKSMRASAVFPPSKAS